MDLERNASIFCWSAAGFPESEWALAAYESLARLTIAGRNISGGAIHPVAQVFARISPKGTKVEELNFGIGLTGEQLNTALWALIEQRKIWRDEEALFKEDVLGQTTHRSFTVAEMKKRQVQHKTGLAELSQKGKDALGKSTRKPSH